MGRLKQTTTAYSFVSGNPFTIVYGYDKASNRTSMTDPNNGQTTYTYDTLNRLTNILDFNSNNFGFSYDALSRRTQLTRPNGVNTNYSYDSVSNLLSVLHQQGINALDGASYTYDFAGNRTSKTNRLNGAVSNFSYDSIYQLTGVTGSNPESYTYDPVGNRLTSQSVSNYVYNSSNQLTTAGSATSTYDDNGNTRTKTDGTGTSTYNWDCENRLTSVQLPNSSTVTFKYDPFGRRIQKNTTNYVYAGANTAEEVDQNGTVLARYTQGQETDEPLSEVRSGTSSYYEQDGLNSVTSLSSSTGLLGNTYVYDAFGNTTASTGTLTNPYQYTGRDYDPETGLRYYRARYYAPELGRFITEDPTGVTGGINLFAYTQNNPLSWVDPFGLYPKVPRCPSKLQRLTRPELDKLIGPLSKADSADLDRGCIGMTTAYQGMNADSPETALGTTCYKTEAEARSRRCPPKQKKFIFAKMGHYAPGLTAPYIMPDGTVSPYTISDENGHFNYVVAFPGGCYGWMNTSIPGPEPQYGFISPSFPDLGERYPHTIWCSTCCSKCMNSQ